MSLAVPTGVGLFPHSGETDVCALSFEPDGRTDGRTRQLSRDRERDFAPVSGVRAIEAETATFLLLPCMGTASFRGLDSPPL